MYEVMVITGCVTCRLTCGASEGGGRASEGQGMGKDILSHVGARGEPCMVGGVGGRSGCEGEGRG